MAITGVVDFAGCGVKDGAIGVTVTGGNQPYFYSWSGPSGFSATTQNIFNLSGGAGMIYVVTVTDAQGCTSTKSFILEDNHCCQTSGFTDIKTTPYWHAVLALSPTSPNNTFIIPAGQYSLNENLVIPAGCVVIFSNCTLEINRRVSIQLMSNAGLQIINNSILRACDKMWRGIVTTLKDPLFISFAPFHDLVKVENSTIKDADIAIFAVNGYEIWTKNVIFNNNIVGIEMPRYFNSTVIDPDVPLIGLNLLVESTTFTHVGQLKPAYVGQVPYKSTPKAGIILRTFNYDNANMRIGYNNWGKNIFSNMNSGIQFIDCAEPLLQNCSFENIHGENFYTGKFYGSAIYCQNNGRSFGLTVSPIVNQSLTTPTINDCDYGIYTDHAGAEISNITMKNMKKGIVVRNAALTSKYSLRNNIIYADSRGIEMDFNAKAASINVNENNIYTSAPTGIGISVVEKGTVIADPFYINNNHIYCNGSLRGIDLLYVNNARIRFNKIYSYSPLATNFAGINLSGSKLNEITNNEVYGVGPTPPDPTTKAKTHGLRFSKSAFNTINCNIVDNTSYGIGFYGELPETDFAGNEMKHHFEGLHLHTDAVIGPQARRGNTWLDPSVYTYGGFGAVNLNIVGGIITLKKSEFTYQPFAITSTLTYSPTIPSNNAGWFTFDPGQTYSCCPTCASISNSDEITQLDIAIAQGDTITSEWTQESFSMAEMYLYKKLDDHPELLSVDAVLQSFYNTHTYLATGLLNLVAKRITTINGYSAYYEGLINSADSLIAAIYDSVNIIDSIRIAIYNDSIYDLERNYLVNELHNLDTAKVNINLQKEALVNNSIIEAYAENASVIPVELPEMNEQVVNELYLVSLSPEFTEYFITQANRLFSVAQQCPYSGGTAVYWARAIYKDIDEGMTYDDFTTCLAQGIFRSSQAAIQNEITPLNLVPNPACDKIKIQYKFEKDVVYYLEIFDNVGRLIKNIKISSENTSSDITTSDIPDGMYIVKLQRSESDVAQSKLIIIN